MIRKVAKELDPLWVSGFGVLPGIFGGGGGGEDVLGSRFGGGRKWPPYDVYCGRAFSRVALGGFWSLEGASGKATKARLGARDWQSVQVEPKNLTDLRMMTWLSWLGPRGNSCSAIVLYLEIRSQDAKPRTVRLESPHYLLLGILIFFSFPSSLSSWGK